MRRPGKKSMTAYADVAGLARGFATRVSLTLEPPEDRPSEMSFEFIAVCILSAIATLPVDATELAIDAVFRHCNRWARLLTMEEAKLLHGPIERFLSNPYQH